MVNGSVHTGCNAKCLRILCERGLRMRMLYGFHKKTIHAQFAQVGELLVIVLFLLRGTQCFSVFFHMKPSLHIWISVDDSCHRLSFRKYWCFMYFVLKDGDTENTCPSHRTQEIFPGNCKFVLRHREKKLSIQRKKKEREQFLLPVYCARVLYLFQQLFSCESGKLFPKNQEELKRHLRDTNALRCPTASSVQNTNEMSARAIHSFRSLLHPWGWG